MKKDLIRKLTERSSMAVKDMTVFKIFAPI